MSNHDSGSPRLRILQHLRPTNRTSGKVVINRNECTRFSRSSSAGVPIPKPTLFRGSNPEKVLPNRKKDNDEESEPSEKEKAAPEIKSDAPSEKKEIPDLSGPKLLTSLKVIENLHSLEEKIKGKGNFRKDEDSSKSNKGARELDVPFVKQWYKDLIDLKVSDEDLGIPKAPVPPKEIFRIKDPEPKLSDFYTPKFDREYIFQPQKPSFQLKDFHVPNPPSVYEITKKWEPNDESIY